MPIYFFDSSALVKRYRHEAGTVRVSQLAAAADYVAIARLAHVEVSATIVRRGRAAGMTDAQRAAVLDQLDDEVRHLMRVVDAAADVFDEAIRITRAYALRGADAIQLASAIAARDLAAPREVVLVGADREMNAAATAEGFHVIDPTQS